MKKNNKISEIIKNNMHIYLIGSGIFIGYIIKFYFRAKNISGANSWAGVIGALLICAPIFTGLWIFIKKEKIKDEKLSKIIKSIVLVSSIFFAFLIIITTLSLLFGF